VHISARVDYAVRAIVELAAANKRGPVKCEQLAVNQGISVTYLENILNQLRGSGLVQSRRGADGGYWLAVPPERITIGAIVRAIDGSLSSVRGEQADMVEYPGAAQPMRDVWLAVRDCLGSMLDHVTVADVVANTLPDEVTHQLAAPSG